MWGRLPQVRPARGARMQDTRRREQNDSVRWRVGLPDVGGAIRGPNSGGVRRLVPRRILGGLGIVQKLAFRSTRAHVALASSLRARPHKVRAGEYWQPSESISYS